MDKWQGKVALVTGASSGIGAAIARELVKQGMTGVGVARRGDIIKNLSKELVNEAGKLNALKTDLRKEEEIREAFAFAEQELGGIDVVVNNSGISETEPFSGHQVDTGRAAVYQAAKHAVTALSMSMRRELADQTSTIKVTVSSSLMLSVSPGFTRTEIVKGTIAELMFDTVHVLAAADVAEAVVNVLWGTEILCSWVISSVGLLFVSSKTDNLIFAKKWLNTLKDVQTKAYVRGFLGEMIISAKAELDRPDLPENVAENHLK